MKINFIKATSLVISALIMAGCSSTGENINVFVQPDYTLEDVRKEESKRIDELAETDLIQAYWRASLLNDEKTIAKISEKVISACNESIKKEEWFKAYRYCSALEYLNYDGLIKPAKDSIQLKQLCESKVSSFTPSADSTGKVSRLINGTVTVWVDKGIRVENGMGYADRVIGSGFFISKDGYIVTNHHVIADLVNPKYEGYARLYVKLAEDTETRVPAKVIGWDSVMDLAVLKTEVEAPYVFSLGSSRNLDVGDKVFCIGSPIGLEKTLTSGIVSAIDRVLFSAGPVMQIDASVNSGNSGGPCVDQSGAVQAVVFAGMLQYSGLNFAIPVEYLKAELPNLVNGGKFEHSWIEASGKTIRSGAVDKGVELNYVMPGGCAFRAGLRAGDIITEIEGTRVSNLEDLQKRMMGIPADSIIKIKYQKDGKLQESNIFVTARPINPGYSFFKNDLISGCFTAIFGMKLNPISESRKKYQIESVIKGSIADENGFSDSDPVEVKGIQFNKDNTAIYAEVYAKNRKKGYLDISMGISAPLDSPYYF